MRQPRDKRMQVYGRCPLAALLLHAFKHFWPFAELEPDGERPRQSLIDEFGSPRERRQVELDSLRSIRRDLTAVQSHGISTYARRGGH